MPDFVSQSSDLGAGDVKGLKSQYNNLRADVVNIGENHVNQDEDVHGLANGVYVLGTNIGGAGRRVEFGRVAWGAGADSDGYYEHTITFTVAFNVAPIVLLGNEVDSSGQTRDLHINSVSTTQLKLRMYRYQYTNTTYAHWLAIGN